MARRAACALARPQAHQQAISQQARASGRVQDVLLEPVASVYRRAARMNQYGVLGRYLPAFGRIVGQMQHDLYPRLHGRRAHPEGRAQPASLRSARARTRVSAVQPHHERLRASGSAVRGGTLSRYSEGARRRSLELGAIDAARFAHEHGFSSEDADLVAWLVANHLIMSLTAQKQDISDPDVVHAFANVSETNAI